MATKKQLIIHADDLGLCNSVNRASFELFKRGCISSASAIVVGARFGAVVEYASGHPKADIGVHLTILSDSKKLQYRPLSPPSRVRSLVDREGFFLSDRALLADRAEYEHVVRECSLQIMKARKDGLNPTHLDSHRDAFSLRKDLNKALTLLACGHGLPCRPASSGKRIFSVDHEAGGPEVVASYLRFLDDVKNGVSQLVVHPGLDGRELRSLVGKDAPWGSLWRQRDYDILRSRQFHGGIKKKGIALIGWRDL